MNGFIRIHALPEGEAPLWVRQAWIGLDLPLAEPQVVDLPVRGVLSGRRFLHRLALRLGLRRPDRMLGFLVPMAEAVAVLDRHAPEAAAWWRQTLPDLQRPGSRFVFDAACGHRRAANQDDPPGSA